MAELPLRTLNKSCTIQAFPHGGSYKPEKFTVQRISTPVWDIEIPNHCQWPPAHHRCQWQLAPDILMAFCRCRPVFHSSTSSCHRTRTRASPSCNHMVMTLSQVPAGVLLVGMLAARCQAGASSTTRVSVRVPRGWREV